jgi:IS1 family transposase
VVYQGVIPAERHQAMTKKARQTKYIEQCNHMLRQRVSRLVRATLAFSKHVEHPIGAIRSFLCDDHRTSAAALLL